MAISVKGTKVKNGPHYNPDNFNYNTGIVGLECYVEPYCPFMENQKQTFNIILNHTTVTQGGFSSADKQNISSVPGVEGIFLKERYIYYNNFFQATGSSNLLPKNADPLIDGDNAPDNANYRWWQTWRAVNHPLPRFEDIETERIDPETGERVNPDGSPLSPEQKAALDADERQCDKNRPSWEIQEVNIPTTALSVYNAEQAEKEDGNPIAGEESKIYMPTQVSVGVPVEREANEFRNYPCDHGVHWRAEKNGPLYMGQDFFIEFHRKAIHTDVINSSEITDFNPEYAFLNSNADLSGQGELGDFDDVYPPPNQGVRTYLANIDYETNTVNGWTSDSDSASFYDMNSQAYYIIELGQGGGPLPDTRENKDRNPWYFIFIPQNYYPTFLQVGQPSNGAQPSPNTSYNISTYKGLHGSDLIDKRSKFRMTVRNHLGKIIITFNSNEDNPWIIETPDLLTVPEGKIRIWGGNISAGFIFSPLTYNYSTQILLPPGVLGTCQGYQFATNIRNSIFEGTGLERLGYELNVGQVGDDGIFRRLPPQSGIEIDEGLIYTCDAQVVRERTTAQSNNVINVGVGGDGEEGYTVRTNFINDNTGPNFLGLKGGISTQLRALQFNKFPQYNGSSPVSPIDDTGQIVQTEGLSKSAIGLTASGGTDGEILEWATSCNLVSGGHYFGNGEDEERGKPWIHAAGKTPIITSLTFTLADIKELLWQPRTIGNRIDHRILNFGDVWSAEDYNKITHTGNMTIYMNQYDTDPAKVTDSDNNNIPDNTYMSLENIKRLAKRQFYVSIDVLYDNCDQLDPNFGAGGPDAAEGFGSFATDSKGLPFQQIKRERIFTGIAKNATITQRHGVQTMDLELVDYWDVLDGKVFFNSPFFDGVRDLNAVYEVLKIGGFSDIYDNLNRGKSPGPAWIMRKAASSDGEFKFSFDGSDLIMTPYALPQSYERLTQPYFKPADGSALADILLEFAKRSNKMMYFDRYGVFHYENRPFDDHIFNTSSSDLPVGVDTVSDLEIEPRWAWVSFPPGLRATTPWDDAIPLGTSALFDYPAHNYGGTGFTPSIVQQGLLVEGEVTINYDIASCYNEFKIVSSTYDREIIIASNVDYNKFRGNFTQRQNEQGWIGYRRPLYQAESIFGSVDAVARTMASYEKIKNPPIVTSFKAKGLPLKALDVGVLHFFDYNEGTSSSPRNIPFIITNASSTIDPNKNAWDQSIEGEWIQSGKREV